MDFGLAKWLLEDVFYHALGDVQGRRDILLAWPSWSPESVAKDWGHGIYIFENRVASGVATDSAFLRAPPLWPLVLPAHLYGTTDRRDFHIYRLAYSEHHGEYGLHTVVA